MTLEALDAAAAAAIREERSPRPGEIRAREAAKILGLLAYSNIYGLDDELKPRCVRVLERTLRFYDRAAVEAYAAAKRGQP